MKRAVIVLPTYNEVGSLEKVVELSFESAKEATNWDIHILVVDSKSTDGTGNLALKLKKRFPKLHLLNVEKEGLGKAYLDGFKYALDTYNPYLLFEMDADLSHNPREIPHFLHAIEKGADFVIGSRYMKGGSIPKDWGLHRKIFSFCANIFIRFGFMKLSITDWTDGFRAVKAWIIKESLPHISNYSGYVFQVALLDFALKKNAHIQEIPVHFEERKHGVSKINPMQYIANIIFYILNHSSFVKFVVVGFVGFGIDFGISFFLIEKFHWLVWAATLVSAETAIICNFFMNNFWSFSHKRIEHSFNNYLFSFLKFNLISSGSIAIQAVALGILTHFLGQQYWYFYKVLVIGFVIIPYSYILYNKFIWKK